MENIKWNENEKSIYYKELETNIIKSIDLINKEIFQIQEHIIDYEQFGEKDINKLGEFSKNYPFQFSFDEFNSSNYWGCEGDEEYLNKMPIKNEGRQDNLDKKINKFVRSEIIDLNFPEKIIKYSDYDKLLSELFINGIENFHPEDDFTKYENLHIEEGKEINYLFAQALDVFGDSYIFKRLTKFREKFINLKYVYKVEWLEGYDLNKDQTPRIEYKSLHDMFGNDWNMEAYFNEGWVEDFKQMEIGKPKTIYIICEKLRYTRIL